MSDSTDSDVVSSGLLLGLSCSGNFELQTAYFTAGTYNNGCGLTFDAATGNIKSTTAASTDTFIQNPNVDIIGYVSVAKVGTAGSNTASLDLAIGGPGGGYGTKTVTGVANSGVDSQSAPVSGHTYVVQWVTRWLPAREVTAATT